MVYSLFSRLLTNVPSLSCGGARQPEVAQVIYTIASEEYSICNDDDYDLYIIRCT